jgi:uncharacterized SAM-binding protein YcdF (DUF218 family)
MLTLLNLSLPGSIPFLVAAYFAGLLLLARPRSRRVGQCWLWGLFGAYFAFSLPVVSHTVAAPLSWGYRRITRPEELVSAQAVVVLDGGTWRYQDNGVAVELPDSATAMRIIEAVQVCRLIGTPPVIVSGGDSARVGAWAPEASVMRDALVKLGIRPDQIYLDSTSTNTRAHALNVLQILHRRGVSRFALVTSPTHIRRALLSFRALGADPIACPSALAIDRKQGWQSIWPSAESLDLVEQAMHDYVALAYYQLRGWL